jgi:glucose-6-phosphate 1-dehydrogenase
MKITIAGPAHPYRGGIAEFSNRLAQQFRAEGHTIDLVTYERLLFDVMIGDSTLFSRDDEVETAWKFIEPVQKVWAENKDIKIFGYPAGTWGPEHDNDLFEGDGLTWRYPCKNLADDGLYCEL